MQKSTKIIQNKHSIFVQYFEQMFLTNRTNVRIMQIQTNVRLTYCFADGILGKRVNDYMNTNEMKNNNNYGKKKCCEKRHPKRCSGKRSVNLVTTLLLVAAAFTVILLLNGTVRSNAQSTERNKLVTSVYVERGDILWDIASKYYTKDCGSMKDYIKEIKRTNNIDSDTIYYGYSILIPYYR